ncbi:MAG: phosphopantetheine adenylyltransferase [Gammaproteobacteria bacterium]
MADLIMQRVVSIILIAVGLMNFYPAIGVLSAVTLSGLYGIELMDGDILLLMRHRAVLFGILGGFLIVSAFRRQWQSPVIAAGFVSMAAFVALTAVAGEPGDPIRRIAAADLAGCIALVAVCVIRRRATR